MANRIKKQEDTKNSYKENVALIMGAFTLLVLCILPLIFRDYYFNILETKYQFYAVVSIAALVIMGGYGLASGKMFAWFSHVDWKELKKSFRVSDWAMIIFWLVNVISWACSEWKWEAFWGTSGRYNGAFLMTIYMAVYFLVTRFFKLKQWYLDAFLAVGILVCLFGITDYFQMNIFGFKTNMVDYQKSLYTSTFGNINTYTIYVAALFAVSMVLFTSEKNQKRMYWYFGNMILSCFALIMGLSDNAYLSVAAIFGFSPLWLFKTKTGLRRYVICLASLVSVIYCMKGINTVYADSVVSLDSAFFMISKLKFLPVIVIILWALVGVLTAKGSIQAKKPKSEQKEELPNTFVYAWIGVIVLVVLAVCFVLYDANLAGHADRYNAISSYVVFNDDWGTQRGYVWRCAMELYTTKLNALQKIIGYGPDTFALLMEQYYSATMQNGSMVVYDSAHNEYLHYLVTIGAAGMIAYIVFMISSVVVMAKKIKEEPAAAAIMLAVLAYMTQATVNINLPIAMPIILQLLAMGVGRKKKPEEG